MKPGIYYDLPFPTYTKADGLNQSKLKVLKRSPRKFLHAIEVGREDTEALGIGRAIHTAVLEPEKFHSMFFQLPELNLRTTAGKAERDALLVANEGKEALKADDYQLVFDTAAAVLGHSDAAKLLRDTTREMCIWWKDEATDVLCKARLDAYHAPTRTIVDLKTTQDASPAAFRKSIYQYGYHLQAGWYAAALRAHGVMVDHFVIIAVEKASPFDVGVYRLTDEVLKLSRKENQALLRQYAQCLRTDNWPGYTEGIVDIGLPDYALSELEATHGESI